MVAAALFFDSAYPKSWMVNAVDWRSQRVPDSPTMTVAGGLFFYFLNFY